MCAIYETFDYGYDPSIPEETAPIVVPRPAALSASASVNSKFMLGRQADVAKLFCLGICVRRRAMSR